MSLIPLLSLILLQSLLQCNVMTETLEQDILNPLVLKPYMFKKEITGETNVLLPTKKFPKDKDNIYKQFVTPLCKDSDSKQSRPLDEYVIQMVKTKQQILPKELNYGKTTIYAYAGQTKSGYKASFPGPAIMATKDRPIKIRWRNKIPGPHIMPVDTTNPPFQSSKMFTEEVPTVPHAHGIAVKSSSDGQPQHYWTSSGKQSALYTTEQKCPRNQAIYIYPNEQEAGNNWYHDHTMGITRLNVYAGLAGLYKITDPNCKKEKKIVERYGKQVAESKTKFLVVTDKTFKTNGELFYPTETRNPQLFTHWVPQFFGNTMLVNGVLWPVLKLSKGLHRIVLLNACQSRYLNIYFENSLGQKVPMKMLRVDNDFYKKEVSVDKLLATISTRFQFLLDLTNQNGEIILKNNAPTPFPMGSMPGMPGPALDEFTGQIMKIKIVNTVQGSQCSQENSIKTMKKEPLLLKSSTYKYPAFDEGKKVFTTLLQAVNENDEIDGMFIDGMSMMMSQECPNNVYKVGMTYDFYLINLTPDTHPIHFHLVNMQKVKEFQFNVEDYKAAYYEKNGVPMEHGFHTVPTPLDPSGFKIGNDIYPEEVQKVFRDTIDANPNRVTVIRVKFAKNDGSKFKSFNLSGQRYVMHCHILQHEDNQMMKYYCLK